MMGTQATQASSRPRLLRWACAAALALVFSCAGNGGSGADGADGPNGPGKGNSAGNGANGANGGDPNAPGKVPDAVGITKTDPCFTPEQSFAWELYGGVFSRCIGCHNEFGLARQVGVQLRLIFPGEPEFASKNVSILSSYAQVRIDANGTQMPILLAKPTASTAHVGGEVIAPGSAEAKLLESFIDKLANPKVCTETPDDAAQGALAGLTLAGPRETYARAKFILSGELATPEELDGLENTEEMLDQQLNQLMTGEPFLARVQEMFADWLLTDAYSSLVRGDDLFPQLRDYPRTSYYQPLCTPERDFRCCDAATEACCVNVESDPARCTAQLEDASIDAVAREPLELVKYIVENDLPMTELVTAQYGVANPYSATVYGVADAQRGAMFDADASNDAREFSPMLLTPTPQNNLRAEGMTSYPHAGILSMPVVLVRYPSSDSNQQRTRAARLILERMLAIPVMKLSDFSTAKLPPDADLELATQEYAACTVCHAAIDPIAGHFRNFGSAGQFRASNRQRLAEHLPDPAFLGQTVTTGSTEDPLRWLGAQVAKHPRFGLGVLMPVFADMIGTDVITPPSDMLSEDYKARYMAWRIQQIEIQRLRREFTGSAGLRLKPLVKAIVKGPFFRAVGASPQLDEVTRDGLAVAGVGLGSLLTPEQLARKIESLTGLSYRSGLTAMGRDVLRSFRDYRLMFGGTDWDATPNRYREPNAMAVRIAMRMGNEMACLAVPQDFALADPAARRLFPNVDLTTTPESGGEAAIRKEIRRLHRLLLNEDRQDGDPELEATYQLWVSAHQAVGTSSGGRNGGGGGSRSRCQATGSFAATPVPYPDAAHRVVNSQFDSTVRPWMAVIAYLLSDGRFFLQ